MRNKLFIILSGVAVLVIVVVLILILLMSGGSGGQGGSNDPFGDTSGERPFDIDTDLERPGSGASSTPPVLHGQALPVLRKLTEEPVSAVTTLSKRDEVGVEPYARYTERATGHVLDANLVRTTQPTTMSIVTIPRIQLATWGGNASTSLVQYFNQDVRTLYTFFGTLRANDQSAANAGELPPYFLNGGFLPEDITTIALNPDGTRVFYIVSTDTGSVGYVESVDGGNRRQVWNSPLRELVATWNAPGYILVATKPSSSAPSWVWEVNPNTGKRDLLLSEVLAVTTLANPTGDRVLYSTLETTLASLRVLMVTTGKVVPLPLVTLPEKCTWSKRMPHILYCGVPKEIPRKNEFPEGWYQGTITWQDNIWRIDTDAGTTKLLLTVSDLANRTMDIVDPVLAPDEDFLLFRAKEDDSLWSYKLPEAVPVATTTTSGF